MAKQSLVVTYNNQLHKCHLIDNEPKSIKIGKENSNHITFPDLEQSFTLTWNGTTCELAGDEKLEDHWQVAVSGKIMEFYVLDDENRAIYDTTGVTLISIGKEDYADITIAGIQVDVTLIKRGEQQGFALDVIDGKVYHNLSPVKTHVNVHPGDHLFIDGVEFIVGEKEIQLILASQAVTSKLVPLLEVDHPYHGDYPDYHRSPRIIYREPEEKKEIAKPTNKPSKPSEQLARTIVPPLVLIVALVLISLIQPRGIYILVMMTVTVTTIIFSITSYVKKVRKYKHDIIEREETYKAYLQRKTKELYRTSEEQRHALYYHYPNVERIRDMAMDVDARLYEKTVFHHDFLNFRTGIGKEESSFEINFNDEEFTQKKDELIEQARALLDEYQEIEEVPVVTSLMKGPVGYIGHRQLVLEQLQLLVMQLAIFHSYHDLQFITIFPEEEKSKWDWMRWLPHASLRDVNVRGFVYHERSRDQVLNTLYQILKERKLTLEEKESKNERTYFSPHFVVLITDEKLILDHTIMEFFNEDPTEYGTSLIFVQDVMHALPEQVKTVIDIRDAKEGQMIIEEGELVNRHFAVDHFPKDFNKEEVSRALAPINHLQTLKSSIPESVTFLEMYGVETVEELTIGRRWAINETYKSLAVPLGLRGKDDIVQLNLHEKAHGPHGLVAGTTGSGKSEIIQSYIISLGVNFHPHEVAFLLIDYKGGGMANLFKSMPHLVGTITNLDAAQSMRALASIKAELQKRQRLFEEHEVNHINQYQKLYKQGEVSEAMPHLFLISDEFAELKSEQPDFMKELVSTARIGRSLGIHLILATQKPSGVVDEQIWSNSKFKLALKVQDAGDSNEILKTPDAAEITLPGRAYLQVGNNEIYELFQSAFSGADYVPNKGNDELIDTTVYAINDLGQYDVLTEDLSGLDHKEMIEKVPTELEAVIDHIAEFTKQEGIAQLPRPWLPPLPERIWANELHPLNYKEEWNQPKKLLKVTIGKLDQPDRQSQSPLELDLSKDGHLAVFASPGYGKSTFLQTVMLDLVQQHNPEQLHVYLLDFGTNGILPLKDFPHVADTIQIDDDERIGKFIRILTSMIKERKQKLSRLGVANLNMYERASGELLPNTFIIIDNFDSVREASFAEEFEKLMTQIAREGSSVGLYLVISAGRQNALKMPLLSNIKIQIPLYLIERTEARSIVGKTDIVIEEIPGRGLVKLEDPTLFQTMLPIEGEESLDMIDHIQALAEEMDKAWAGERPEKIPMMPEGVLDFESFINRRQTKDFIENKRLPLGLEFEKVEPIAFDPEQQKHLTVVSDRHEGLERMNWSLAKNLATVTGVYQTMIIDTDAQDLADIGMGVNAYISEYDGVATVKETLLAEMEQRLKNRESSEGAWLIQIADLKDFSERSNLDEDDIETFLEQGEKAGIHFVICGDQSYIGKSFEPIPKYVRNQSTVGLISMRLSDQDIFQQPFIRQEKYPAPYECYYVMDYQHIRIKIPK